MTPDDALESRLVGHDMAAKFRSLDTRAWAAHAASFGLHVLLLLAGMWLQPVLEDGDAEIAADRMTMLRTMAATSDGEPVGDGSGDAPHADVAAPSPADEPSAGAKSSGVGAALASPGRPAHARERAGFDDASSFGMIGLLAGSAGEAGSAGPWAAAPGDGGFAGAEDLFGASLSGFGEGGGGSGAGVGIGRIGTRGHAGAIDRKPRFGDHYATKAAVLCGIPLIERRDALGNVLPQPPCPTTMVSGRLPPETVQRIVRQNFGRFRACYESGLAKNPSLEGRVVVKFVIARDGSVIASQDDGSELGDGSVVACIVRAMGTLSFPQPEGGIVTVAYPLVLSSG